MVWFRISALSSFRKLYGTINQPLKAGTYFFHIQNNYPVHAHAGKKYFILTTKNKFGGQNFSMAIIYISSGMLCIFCSAFFGIAWQIKRKSERDRFLYKTIDQHAKDD